MASIFKTVHHVEKIKEHNDVSRAFGHKQRPITERVVFSTMVAQ